MAKPDKKEVAVKKSTEVATQADIPDFLKDKMKDNRGSEEVQSNDLVIPRVELVQSLSKCRKKADPAYIEGIEEGMLYNNVTRKIYGEEMVVCPVYFRKEWLLWRDQDLGGGFGGAFDSAEAAEHAREGLEKPDEWEVVDTNQHFVLVINDDGSVEEAVISMAKTKAKTSRNWNSLVRINSGPRFSRLYKLVGVGATNKANQDYFTLDVKNVGFVSEEVFKHAEKVYEMVTSGKAGIDRTFDDASFDDDAGDM